MRKSKIETEKNTDWSSVKAAHISQQPHCSHLETSPKEDVHFPLYSPRNQKVTDRIAFAKARLKQISTPPNFAQPQSKPRTSFEPPVNPADYWKKDLLATLKSIHPSAFERLSQRLLIASGFIEVNITGRAGDGGIDGKGILNMNLISFHVYFQCKRYSGMVGSRDLRNFRGAMQGRGDKGLFITTGVFSNEAKKEATRDGAPTIDLIDGNHLCELLKELSLGIRTELVEKVTVSKDYFLSI